MHAPWLEQLAGQAACSQDGPVKGGSHAHVAVPRWTSTMQGARAEHAGVPGHAGRSHAPPDQPGAQRHRPLLPHLPCVSPPHSLPDVSAGHAFSAQSSPFHPP